MNVSIGERWERCEEEREARIRTLRASLEASIAAGGAVNDDELDAALAERAAGLRRRGLADRGAPARMAGPEKGSQMDTDGNR